MTSWLAPYSSPNTLSRLCATALEEWVNQTYGPLGFFTGRALVHTEEALTKALEEKNDHPRFSGRKVHWPICERLH